MATGSNGAEGEGSSSREKILDVAETLFARRSYSGVGMREVAHATGFGKSSLFHHFKTKLQLYGEVLGRVLTRIDDHLRPVLVAEIGAVEKLDRWLDVLIDVLAEHPAWSRLLLRALFEDEELPESDTPERASAEQAMQSLIAGCDALLREGIARGVFRRVPVAHAIQTMIGATVYHFASGRFGDELLGRPMLSAEEVSRRKEFVRMLFHEGIVA